ncbi:unnamed protein product [Phytophthora fragariaefolia]|uniref:Unnamed protein product n=1 Tax=Phytophthora fragariaefolia TaxID=1490495 RepID=A0A9W6XNH2_9STRA|nr:unnamed protein product [Phytophthora fragariaefolia]
MPGKRKRGGVRGQDYFIGEERLMKFLDRMDLGKKKRVYHVLGFSTDIVCLALAELARNHTSTTQIDSPSPSPLKPASAQPHVNERTTILQAQPHQREGEDKSSAARPDEAPEPLAPTERPATPVRKNAPASAIEGVSPHDTSYIDTCSSSDNDSDSSGIAAPGTAIGEEQPRAQDIEEMKEDSPIGDPGLANLYTHDKWMNLTCMYYNFIQMERTMMEQIAMMTKCMMDEMFFWYLKMTPPPQPELLFDDLLLALVGGHAQLASGQVDKNLLKLMAKTGWNPLVKQTPYDYLMEPCEQRPATAMQDDYPGLYTGPYGRTSRALNAASTPARAFFFFAQPTLWEDIAAASNDYFLEKMDERVEGHYNKQLARIKKKPQFKPKSQDQIRAELSKIKVITVRELCVFVGL